ncbi:hypothetical protein LCGC14_2921890, partial [marine sediment metagenome]
SDSLSNSKYEKMTDSELEKAAEVEV